MRTLSALLCLWFASYTYAQDKLPAFGKIDKADLQMKDCSFDPGAEAYWLIDLAEVQYNLTPGQVYIQTDYRCRIKILNEKGIPHADIKIHYYSNNNYESITNIDGFVYNLDDAGNITTDKLDGKQVFNKKIDDRYSQVSFAMPNVKAGSVIEYRYRGYKKSIENIDDWYFQRELPVRYSAYNLVIPEYFDFNYKVIRRQDMDVIKSTDADKGIWFVMRNIPALKEEPYTAGINDYYQRVDFQLAAINPPGQASISYRTTWSKLNDELVESESFGGQLRKNLPGMDGLKAILKKTTNDREKVKLIYSYVQKNMDWNGRHSIYSIDGIKQAWDKKSGSTGDINLLLVNLLKDAGLKAVPMLTSTKDNGKVNQLATFLQQFNQVLACVELNDSSLLVMDGTDKYNPYTLVPYDVQSTMGLVIDKKGPNFINLATNTELRHSISVQLMLDEDGKLHGESVINSYDYGKNVRLNTYRKGKLKDVFSLSDGITITPDSIAVNNADSALLPLEQHLWLTGSLQPSGGYSFIPYNLFTGLGKNPFTAEKRQTDIDFNYPQKYVITGSVIIPENYSFDDLPKNMRMIMADTSISLTRILQKDDHILSFRVTLDFKRPIYAADEYQDVKEFFKQLYEALEEKIVLKKKS